MIVPLALLCFCFDFLFTLAFLWFFFGAESVFCMPSPVRSPTSFTRLFASHQLEINQSVSLAIFFFYSFYYSVSFFFFIFASFSPTLIGVTSFRFGIDVFISYQRFLVVFFSSYFNGSLSDLVFSTEHVRFYCRSRAA